MCIIFKYKYDSCFEIFYSITITTNNNNTL